MATAVSAPPQPPFGLVTFVQACPSQCSIRPRSREACPVPVVVTPTAQASLADTAVTALSCEDVVLDSPLDVALDVEAGLDVEVWRWLWT